MRRLVAGLAALAGAAIVASGCGGDDLPPLPADRPIFGFNEAIAPDGAGNELIADSGASFVRIALNWATVEATEGERKYAVPDSVNEELAAIGLRPLWVVTGAPCWAAQVSCAQQRPSLAPAPEHLDDFAGFAAEVAERYPEALAIEVWNEPNIPNFWRPVPDASLYRELLARTAAAVRAADSGVPVIMAGPSPTTDEQAAADPQKIPFVEFIEEVMGGGDAPEVDAIGVHPYSLLQRGTEPVEESIRLFDEAYEAAQRVAPELPVWVTEVGLTTAGRYAVSPEVQAQGLARIFEDFESKGIPVITVHRFFDQEDPPLRFEEGFGIVASDRQTRKPAFCELAAAVGAECETPDS